MASSLLLHVEKWMVKGGTEMCIWYLFNAEVVKCFQIHLCLSLLELLDGNLSVVDGQEVYQLLEVSDLLCTYLNGSLEGQNVALLLWFGFEECFYCWLALGQLIKLLLVFSLLLLGVELSLHHTLSALKTVIHTWDIQEFSLDPHVGIEVWILNSLGIVFELLLEVINVWMGKNSLVIVLVRVVGEGDILVLHQGVDQISFVTVSLVSNTSHFL